MWKKTVARRILIPAIVLIFITFIIFTCGSYCYMKNEIIQSEEHFLNCIGKNLVHDLEYKLRNMNSEEKTSDDYFIDEFVFFAEGVCNSHNIDYVSMYSIDFDEGIIKYDTLIRNENIKVDSNTKDFYKDGYVKDISKIENADEFINKNKMVFEGDSSVEIIHIDNIYGNELSAVFRVRDYSNQYRLIMVEKSYNHIMQKVNWGFLFSMIFMLSNYIIMFAILYMLIKYNVVIPAGKVSNEMERFIVDGKRTPFHLSDKVGYEFRAIEKSFNHMADNISEYINHICELNEAREYQKAEINVLSEIQRGFLRKGEYESDICKINAIMNPAKNIGGDLYDYSKLDDNNYLILVADVSGKGISASIFMTVALTLMRQLSTKYRDPAYILEKTNNYLYTENSSLLFVTAFIGIYNSSEMSFVYANAGHNYPYVISDKLIKLDGNCGTVLGLFEDEKYENTRIMLKTNDMIFLYTDGITDSLNVENKFYGIERLEDKLMKYCQNSHSSVINDIIDDVNKFSENVQQNDDITMLSFEVKKKKNLFLKANESEFMKIRELIMNSDLDRELKLTLCLITEELFINICSYGYTDVTKDDAQIEFCLEVTDVIKIVFIDNGKEYNPLEDVITVNEYDVDEREGGLGKMIAFNFADEVNYEFIDGKNKLTLIKKIGGGANDIKESM